MDKETCKAIEDQYKQMLLETNKFSEPAKGSEALIKYKVKHHNYELRPRDFSKGLDTDLGNSVWFQKNTHYKTERTAIRIVEQIQEEQKVEEAKVQQVVTNPDLEVYGDRYQIRNFGNFIR